MSNIIHLAYAYFSSDSAVLYVFFGSLTLLDSYWEQVFFPFVLTSSSSKFGQIAFSQDAASPTEALVTDCTSSRDFESKSPGDDEQHESNTRDMVLSSAFIFRA
ncbi:hypothetical protein V8G54_019008 [Vigna mungo]|uniref:Uncharacterized protein n=1 Tax=Vigna mungo TaxID=3915 RepID=A0AAQ3NAM0_VIGMU